MISYRISKYKYMLRYIHYAVALLMFAALFGCGQTDNATTLILLGSADDVQKPYLTKLIRLYEESSGNHIQLQTLPNSNFETMAQTLFESGGKPDLFMHFSGYQLDTYRPVETFYDFSDAEWVADVEDMILPQCKRDGKVYGLPFWEASVSGCFYNKKLFRELGIGKLPETQEEFNELCDLLTSKGVQPIYMAMGDTWPILYQFALDPVFAGASGAELIAKLNRNEIRYADIPEFAQMLEWFKMAAERGWFGSSYMTDGFSSELTSQKLNSGQAAMIFCWDSWFYTDFTSTGAPYDVNDFGIMPIFMGTCRNGTFEGPNISLLLVNKDSPHLEQALEFIHFASRPENYNPAFEGIGTIPVFKTQSSSILSTQYIDSRNRIEKLLNESNTILQIIGFSQHEGASAIKQYIAGDISLNRCIALMDADRIATANLAKLLMKKP